MTKKDDAPKAAETTRIRDERLKRALKANLARRKAQVKARRAETSGRQQDQEQDKG